MTAPARIRLLRDADNPWYELILIEGRNREIRKMFEEVGHHVEKIRRVGYGPLVLDLEPGLSRDLTPDEVAALRRAAEGKRAKSAKIDLPARKMPRPRSDAPPRSGAAVRQELPRGNPAALAGTNAARLAESSPLQAQSNGRRSIPWKKPHLPPGVSGASKPVSSSCPV